MTFASFQGDSVRALMRPAACASFAGTPIDAQREAPGADLAIQAKPTNALTGIWTRQSLPDDMSGIHPWLGRRRTRSTGGGWRRDGVRALSGAARRSALFLAFTRVQASAQPASDNGRKVRPSVSTAAPSSRASPFAPSRITTS